MLRQEIAHGLQVQPVFLTLRRVAAVLEDHQFAVRQARGQLLTRLQRRDPVVAADSHEHRHGNLRQSGHQIVSGLVAREGPVVGLVAEGNPGKLGVV